MGAMKRAIGATVMGGSIALGLARGRRPALRVTRHRVAWPELSAPRTVAQLSDLHVGWSTPEVLFREVLAALEAEPPDLVALTGDYVNVSRVFLRRLERFVAALPAPVVAVLGNHDHIAGAEQIGRALESGGAQVLRNRRLTMLGLEIVGVDDGRTRHQDVNLAFAGVEGPSLVLTHYPPTALEVLGRGARLVLTGHTHAGQLDLPHGLTERLTRFVGHGGFLRGRYALEGGTELYVNAGLGHSRPGMRRGEPCRPELAYFRLDPDE